MPGLVKIGFSTNVPEKRAAELSDPTAIPLPFQIDYWCLTNDVADVEQRVHEHLDSYRVTQDREFFQLEIARAIAVVDEFSKPVSSRFERARTATGYATGPLSACPFCGTLGSSRLCSKCGSTW